MFTEGYKNYWMFVIHWVLFLCIAQIIRRLLICELDETEGYQNEYKRRAEKFADGLEVTRLLMAAYMSAEQGKTIKLPNKDIETFIPAVARGEWNPKG